MRVVLQRVSEAGIIINGGEKQSMGAGLVLLVGIAPEDTEKTVEQMIAKLLHLRIFNDLLGNFNDSLMDVLGELLVVSNFTLYANCKKGRRPSFTQAAHPETAALLYRYMVEKLQETGIPITSGEFGADMQVSLINDGPVTIILDSQELFV